MSVRPGLIALLALAVAGGVASLGLTAREPVSAASTLPNRLVMAQLAADSGAGSGAAPSITPVTATVTATATRTPTPTPTPEVVPEPGPTYTPPDPYYPYSY